MTTDALARPAVAQQAASPRSWGEMYADHADLVWRVLRRMGLCDVDAEDALHEVFLIVARRLVDFDPEKGNEKAWLIGIAANVVRSERRQKRRQARLLTDKDSGSSSGSNGSKHTAGTQVPERQQLRRALEQAISGLPPEHRLVFTMFEIEGLPCNTIAHQLGVPIGTVYSRLHHARKSLKKALMRFRADEVESGS